MDIAAADRWLSRMRRAIRTTHGPGVLRDVGSFAGLFRVSGCGIRDLVLVASADGVGTKLKAAQLTGAHEAIGVDVVAMNVNDILVYGARPIFFLDYLAVGRIELKIMTSVLTGIVKGCRLSGCALLGGETAELPGTYARGEYEVAGFCVGIAEGKSLIDGSGVRVGDSVVGLASSGIHANGFSLVRKVFTPRELIRMKRQLLVPTRIYVKPVLRALTRVSIQAISHVTGGGLSRRLRVLTAKHRGLRVSLRPNSWCIPAVFRTIQCSGSIPYREMLGTFNMGIGMVLVCRPRDASRLIRMMEHMHVPAWAIGTVEKRRS